jgi:arginine-tRNA-protein transferase
VHVRIHHPDSVGPADLDRYLRRGWYRIGQAMVTCRFISSEVGMARGVVWTRTKLEGYRPSRSNRKLMRRNARRYRVEERPLSIDEEHEELYRRYLEVAPGERASTLAGALLAGDEEDRFATRELAVRDEEGKLVGFSVFDVGHESLQSLMGVYDPERGRDSLGYWSLLLEVEHAIERGLRYHYAGYVVTTDGSMDYKLRVGHVEFLHPVERVWRPWDQLAGVELPADRLERALGEVHGALIESGVFAEIHSYRWFEAPAWHESLASMMSEPRVVTLGEGPAAATFLAITYDLDVGRYALVPCARTMVRAEQRDGTSREMEMWVTQGSVDLGEDALGVAEIIAGSGLPAEPTHRAG